jgi:hypothetical protein
MSDNTGYWQFSVVGLPSGVNLSCYGTASQTGFDRLRRFPHSQRHDDNVRTALNSDISGIALTNSTEDPFSLSNTTFDSEAGCLFNDGAYDVAPGQSTNVEATVPGAAMVAMSMPGLRAVEHPHRSAAATAPYQASKLRATAARRLPRLPLHMCILRDQPRTAPS